MPNNPRKWSAEDWLPMLVVPLTSVAAWQLPAEYLYIVFAALALGLLFDIISLVAHVHTLITGRFSSGFPLVGLFLYGWFILAFRKSLLAPDETSLPWLVLYKLLDFLLLAGIHVLCQLPMAFQKPRDQYR